MTKFKTVAVSLTEDLRDRIQVAAKAETISVSAIVRRALARYFLSPNVTERHVLVDPSAHFDIANATADHESAGRGVGESHEILIGEGR